VLKVRIQNPVNISNNIIRPGDLIQFNNQGPYFSIERQDINASPPIPDFPLESPNNIFFDFSKAADTDNDGWVDNYVLTLTLDSYKVPMQALPWSSTAWSGPIAFKIMRQPAKSAAAPLQLPAGSVVDLDFSGTDYQTFKNPPGNYYDVAIIFSPNGSVEGYYWNNQSYPALGPIFMLIGSRSRVRDFVAQPLFANPNLNELPNWADLSNIWVTINYQTGMAASDEIFAINPTQQDSAGKIIDWTIAPNWNWTNASNWPFFINMSRNYARQSQSMGGR
jgi:signal peptidase I